MHLQYKHAAWGNDSQKLTETIVVLINHKLEAQMTASDVMYSASAN